MPFLEFLLLVECKNWSTAVGAIHVREFASKLEHRACAFGILIAANGIALAVKGISIIVITRAELEMWTDAVDIVELFKLKLCELTVDGSIFV